MYGKKIILILLSMWIVNALSTSFALSQNLNTAEAKQIERAGEKVYKEAIELFDDGNFWQCSKKLFIIMDFYTEFSKLDKVIYYMGECLYEEEINGAAQKMFKYVIRKYTESRYFCQSMFVLQKASYQEGD